MHQNELQTTRRFREEIRLKSEINTVANEYRLQSNQINRSLIRTDVSVGGLERLYFVYLICNLRFPIYSRILIATCTFYISLC